ncbi:hypothetical protein [Pedobacter miscanthi]|uniref:TIGR02646 family protein n=1 Tax=Pedobacter miscanthi TaxID=2259170 RepID=A0A366KYK9_9SPHI|nr:hypothetical protein [Pedobacter miscanthi]RBQ06717.1 hypothetical protein DRW42_13110 [Pedobacter miscanthi]
MIKITRPAKPDFMSQADNKWDRETQQAIDHFSNQPIIGDFEFNAYRDPELKEELKKVFVKCAYCESIYDQSADGDIEHFRPKGRVNEKNPQSPGYYWLANDWDNLLLSCQHCNQRRLHLLDGDDLISPAGKMDQFPLSDDTKRVHRHGESLQDEEQVRLLINPCDLTENPEDHFEYEDTKTAMIPLSDRAKISLAVYALRRPKLVRARNEKQQFLFKQIDVVRRELSRYNRSPDEEQKAILDQELDNLLFYTSPVQPYAGMCRFFVNKFLTESGLK